MAYIHIQKKHAQDHRGEKKKAMEHDKRMDSWQIGSKCQNEFIGQQQVTIEKKVDTIRYSISAVRKNRDIGTVRNPIHRIAWYRIKSDTMSGYSPPQTPQSVWSLESTSFSHMNSKCRTLYPAIYRAISRTTRYIAGYDIQHGIKYIAQFFVISTRYIPDISRCGIYISRFGNTIRITIINYIHQSVGQ